MGRWIAKDRAQNWFKSQGVEIFGWGKQQQMKKANSSALVAIFINVFLLLFLSMGSSRLLEAPVEMIQVDANGGSLIVRSLRRMPTPPAPRANDSPDPPLFHH